MTQHCPFRVKAPTGASWRASVECRKGEQLPSHFHKRTNERHGPRGAPWRRVGWREHTGGVADKCISGDTGGDRGRGLVRGGGACFSWRSSVSRARRVWHLLGNPRYLMPAPVVGAGNLPAPRPEPARCPAPGPCASASAPAPADTRSTSDTLRHYSTNPKSSSLPNFRSVTAPEARRRHCPARPRRCIITVPASWLQNSLDQSGGRINTFASRGREAVISPCFGRDKQC